MSWSSALRVPLDTDLALFLQLLQRQDIAYRVTEDSGEQVVWVANDVQAEQVQELYQLFHDNYGAVKAQLAHRSAQPPQQRSAGFTEQLRRSPMTTVVLIACLVVALLTQLGDNLATIRWFTFNDFQIQGDYVYFASLEYSLAQGQWWRLISPMLLHFGVLHLAMNMMWYWELGRRIEYQQGWLFLLALTLVSAVVSNASQFIFSGASLFGGLSGVLYAVLGHCWIYQRIFPQASYALPKGVVAMMLIWLLLCLFGVVSALGFGQIANAAHVSGLLVGCLSGGVFAFIARQRAA
ncbi:MAG: rhomboid family intramembrane serine protease [Gammaproteobacteria bacterium]|nr:rhomboid family intramembrane serine protease [Gammaproteobacteria bacterium]